MHERLADALRCALSVALICAGTIPAPASAGQQSGRVVQLIVRASDGLIYAYLDGAASGKPACATNSYWMIKSESTLVGRQHHATLLAAKLSGKTLLLIGANTCTRWGDGEDINEIWLQD